MSDSCLTALSSISIFSWFTRSIYRVHALYQEKIQFDCNKIKSCSRSSWKSAIEHDYLLDGRKCRLLTCSQSLYFVYHLQPFFLLKSTKDRIKSNPNRPIQSLLFHTIDWLSKCDTNWLYIFLEKLINEFSRVTENAR